jgi:hypothetical protein
LSAPCWFLVWVLQSSISLNIFEHQNPAWWDWTLRPIHGCRSEVTMVRLAKACCFFHSWEAPWGWKMPCTPEPQWSPSPNDLRWLWGSPKKIWEPPVGRGLSGWLVDRPSNQLFGLEAAVQCLKVWMSVCTDSDGCASH